MKQIVCIALLVAAPAFAQTSHDVMFADSMIRHHEDGIRMAQMAVDKAMDAELRDMARMMIDDQRREIDQLRSLRGNAPQTPMSDIMKMPGMMPDSEMQRDMARLESATGPRFDVAFTEIMAKHHKGAIAMSNDELRRGSHAGLEDLARQIANKQSGERERLMALHREMTGESPAMLSSSGEERQRMRKE